eukprot:scaffold106_cov380-Prasinococcus_capsulatus_cf.AAC.9
MSSMLMGPARSSSSWSFMKRRALRAPIAAAGLAPSLDDACAPEQNAQSSPTGREAQGDVPELLVARPAVVAGRPCCTALLPTPAAAPHILVSLARVCAAAGSS